jgi:hypothetical protein
MGVSGKIVLVAAVMFATLAFGQDKPAKSADEQAMMKQYMEMVAPGPQHISMAKDVGKWSGAMKMWMQPGAPVEETTTTKEVHMDMDGRYMIEDESSMMNGMPYHGHNTVGYDKFRGEYVFSYFDNMSTGIMTASGKPDADGKTITFNCKMDDPMTNRKDVPTRMIVKHIDDDHNSFEMWTQSPDGKEYKCMDCTYTRMK